MNAGFNRQCITPPNGTRMMGWEDRDSDHGCEGVHDDLYVRALWLEDGEEKLLILSFDLCFFSRDLADRIKGAIGRKIDLSPRQIFINTSHTHDGPSTATFGSAAFVVPDRLYIDSLERATLCAAFQAMSFACKVSLSTGSVQCPISINRRNTNSEGKLSIIPNPDGIVYDEVPVCLFKNVNNEPVCLLFSASCHPTTIFGFQITADYPGSAMQKLDSYLGKECSMFLQGVGGDAKVKSFSKEGEFGRTWEDVDIVGGIIADNVNRLLTQGLHPVQSALWTDQVEMDWPMEPTPNQEKFKEIYEQSEEGSIFRMWAKSMLFRLGRGETLPTSIQISMHVVQLGEGVRIVGLEGEPVADLGYLIQNYFDSGITFPLGYTDGCQLYLPTTKMLDEGGYEVESYLEYGFPAPLASGIEDRIIKALKDINNRHENIAE